MKNILFIFLLIPSLCFGQNILTYDGKVLTYGGKVSIASYFPPSGIIDTTKFCVDAIDGNDSGTGYANDPWQTISKVNGETYDSGDEILFNQGDTWTGTMLTVPDDSITFDAYGSGDKPILNGRDTIAGWSVSGNWTQDGNSYYLKSVSKTGGRLRIWADNIERRRSSSSSLDTLNFWYHSTDTLWIFASVNPTVIYSSIQKNGGSMASIYMANKTGITINNIDVRGYQNGIYADGASELLIENCNIGRDVPWSGFQSFSTGAHPDCSDGIIRNNTFDTWDTLYYAYNSTPTEDAIHLRNEHSSWNIHNNSFINWHHGALVLWQTETGDSMTNITFHDNDITAPDIDYGRAFTIAVAGTDTNCAIYNNYIHNTTVRNQLTASYWKIYNNIIDSVMGTNHTANLGQGFSFDLAVGEDYYIIGNQIYNNIFRNCYNYGIVIPAYVVDTVYDNVVRNNIFVDNDEAGSGYDIYLADRASVGANTYQNNLIDGSIYYGHDAGDSYTKTVAQFNAEDGTAGDSIRGNVDGAPVFYAVGDYHLNVLSLGIEIGDDLPLWLATDYEGRLWSNPPSVGVYDSIYPDHTAPIALSAEIGDRDDSILVIIFDEYLDQDSVPPTSAINVTEGTATWGVNALTISGDSLLVAGDSVGDVDSTYLVDYTRDFPYLQDTSENTVVNFADTTVTNTVAGASTLDNGLQAAWNFEESTGDILDQVGSLDGTVTGSPTREQAGKNNYAYDWSGSAQFSDHGTNVLAYEVFTVSLWINRSASGYLYPISNFEAAGDGWFLYQNGTTLRFTLQNDDGSNFVLINHTANIADGAWHNVILTYDGSEGIIYINNVADSDDSDSWAYDLVYTSAEFQIAAVNDGSPWDGLIDEVYIWNRVITSDERADLQTKFYPSW